MRWMRRRKRCQFRASWIGFRFNSQFAASNARKFKQSNFEPLESIFSFSASVHLSISVSVLQSKECSSWIQLSWETLVFSWWLDFSDVGIQQSKINKNDWKTFDRVSFSFQNQKWLTQVLMTSSQKCSTGSIFKVWFGRRCPKMNWKCWIESILPVEMDPKGPWIEKCRPVLIWMGFKTWKWLEMSNSKSINSVGIKKKKWPKMSKLNSVSIKKRQECSTGLIGFESIELVFYVLQRIDIFVHGLVSTQIQHWMQTQVKTRASSQ